MNENIKLIKRMSRPVVLKVWPLTSIIGFTQEFVVMQILESHPRPTELKLLEGGSVL